MKQATLLSLQDMFGYYSCYVQLQNNVLVTTLKVLVNAAKKCERETIHEMRESTMIMEGGSGGSS